MLFYNPLKVVSPFVYRLAGMSKYLPQTKDYYERVTLDLGTVRYLNDVNDIYKFLKDESLDTDTKLLWFGDAGIKTRSTTVSNTPLTFVSKGYSLDPTPNDLTQTTELNQPYLSGNIAPNERYGVKNTQQVVRRLIHPEINFINNEKWAVTFVINWEYTFNPTTPVILFDNNSNINSALYLKSNAADYYVQVYDSAGRNINIHNNIADSRGYVGKTTIYTLQYDGTRYLFYRNGEFVSQSSLTDCSWTFKYLFSHLSVRAFSGVLSFYHILGGEFTAPQVAAEHSMLRSIYPEIESVQIGTQTWATSNLEMVATPMGNVIPEMQDAGDWASATDIYNITISEGATEDEAIQEAAMWCYPNNDPNIGAVMGKLYNKYAAKLLLNDITAYNVANPTAHWGWNVPTRAQLTTLSAQGGNASKVGGTDYWTTANGSNSNGLTLLGSGYRQADGTFADLKATTGLLCNDADFVRQVINADNSFDEAAITTEGYSIRLIKDE